MQLQKDLSNPPGFILGPWMLHLGLYRAPHNPLIQACMSQRRTNWCKDILPIQEWFDKQVPVPTRARGYTKLLTYMQDGSSFVEARRLTLQNPGCHQHIPDTCPHSSVSLLNGHSLYISESLCRSFAVTLNHIALFCLPEFKSPLAGMQPFLRGFRATEL